MLKRTISLSSLILCLFSELLFAQAFQQQRLPGVLAVAPGTPLVSSASSPLAAFWNPAGLGLIREFRASISSAKVLDLNYLGAANFYPRIGTFALAFSSLDGRRMLSDSLGWTGRRLDRLSLAFGRRVSQTFFAGSTVHLNRLRQDDETFGTLTLGVLALDHSARPYARAFADPALPFNNLRPAGRFSAALVVYDLPIGKRYAKTFVDAGLSYLLPEFPLVISGAARFSSGRTVPKIGFAYFLQQKISVLAGIDDFALKNAAFGMSYASRRYSIDIAYSLREKNLRLELSTLLGRDRFARARSHMNRSIRLAKVAAYDEALREFRRYEAYRAPDSSAARLRHWLEQKVGEKEARLAGLFREADRQLSRKYFISAALLLKQALELDPGNKRIGEKLAMIAPGVNVRLEKLFKQGLQAYDREEYEVAEKAFKTILALRPAHDKARERLQSLQAYYDQESEELYYRGLGFFNQKRYKNAMLAFERALQLNPQHEETAVYLKLARENLTRQKKQIQRLYAAAQKHARRRNFIDAYKAYRKIQQLDPDDDEAKYALRRLAPNVQKQLSRLMMRGKDYFSLGKFDKARQIFQSVLDVESVSREANRLLARIEEEDKSRIDALFNRALAVYDNQEWDRAIALFDSVLSLESSYEKARDLRQQAIANSSIEELLRTADRHFNEGNFLKAVDYYSQIQERVPENLYISQRIAVCRDQLNRIIERHFNKAINYYTAENYSEAIRELKFVLDIAPGHAASREYLKKARSRLQAIKTLQ